MELSDPGHGVPPPLPLSVLFNPARAEMLFAGSGHTFQEILAALNADKPLPHFPLAVKVRAQVGMTRSQVKSENIVGVLPGSDPKLKKEYVVVSAHLDHLGIGEPVNGDRIYNGAMDDASGDASLIEIARAMKDRTSQSARFCFSLSPARRRASSVLNILRRILRSRGGSSPISIWICICHCFP